MVSRRGEAHPRPARCHARRPSGRDDTKGVEAVGLVRKMVGATNTKEAAPGYDPRRLRARHLDYVTANVALPTIVHASGDVDGELEISHRFSDDRSMMTTRRFTSTHNLDHSRRSRVVLGTRSP